MGEPQQLASCKPAPFSDDPVVIADRENTDYSNKVTIAEAKEGKRMFHIVETSVSVDFSKPPSPCVR